MSGSFAIALRSRQFFLRRLACLPLVTLQRLLKSGAVVRVEEAHPTSAVDAIGVANAHHEANVVVAVITPLHFLVKLASAVGEVEVVVVVGGHERSGASGLPSARRSEIKL